MADPQGRETPPNTIISDCYDGRPRTLTLRQCMECKSSMYAPVHVERRFCGKICRGLFDRRGRVTKVCSGCNVSFEMQPSKQRNSKSGHYFCTRKCKDAAQRVGGLADIQPSHYGNGLSRYRKRAIEAYGAVCKSCGYSEQSKMLDVDHINSNRKDNSVENLQVLCVWCHAVKTRASWPNQLRWLGPVGGAIAW